MVTTVAIQKQILRQAATIIADSFAGSVLPALDRGERKWLFHWETKSLEWLREWRKTDPGHPINYWTWSYMEHGPPPWPQPDGKAYRAKGASRPNLSATRKTR